MMRARVYDERGSHDLLTKTVHDLLPRRPDRTELPVVDPDATALSGAAGMELLGMMVIVGVLRQTGVVLTVEAILDGSLSLVRGGQRRLDTIATNRADPASVDRALAERKALSAKAVQTHSSI